MLPVFSRPPYSPLGRKEATPDAPSSSSRPAPHAGLRHENRNGLNHAVAKQIVPRNERMSQETEKLPPGWQPFLLPTQFRMNETSPNSQRGVENFSTNSDESPDQVLQRKLPERPVDVQANSMKPYNTLMASFRVNSEQRPPQTLTPHSRDAEWIEHPAKFDILCGTDGRQYNHRE